MGNLLFVLCTFLGTAGILLGSAALPDDFHDRFIKLLNEKNFEGALELARVEIERNPTDCVKYRYLAQAAERTSAGVGDVVAFLERERERNSDNACLRFGLGSCYKSQKLYLNALNQFQAAIGLNPDFSGSYLEVAWIQTAQRDYEKATASYLEAIRVARRQNDIFGEVDARIQLAVLYSYTGYPEKALQCLNEALTLLKDRNRPDQEALALLRMVKALVDMGAFHEAEEKCLAALRIYQDLNDRRLYFAFQSLGDIHLAQGNRAMAREHAQREYQTAIDYYANAMGAAREARLKQWLLVLLGDAYRRYGDLGKAQAYYRTFLSEVPETLRAFREIRINALGGLGAIEFQKQNYPQALTQFQYAADVAREDRNKRLELLWLKRIGDVYSALEDYDHARAYYDEILRQVKDGFLIQGTESREEQFLFFEEEAEVYEAMVDLLLRMDRRRPGMNYAREALDYAERSRAQSILQALFQSRIVERMLQGSFRTAFHKSLVEIQGELNNAHRARLEKLALMERMEKSQSEPTTSTLNQVKSIDMEIENLHKRIVHLIKRRLDHADAMHVADRLQQERLKENEVLIEYMIADEKTFVFIVGKRSLHYEVLPFGRKGYRMTAGGAESLPGVTQMVQRVSPMFNPIDGSMDGRPLIDARWASIQLRALQEVYRCMFQPVARSLPPGAELIIVPDDILYLLPFEMLVTGFKSSYQAEYLLAQYPISYAYSASLLLDLPRPVGDAVRQVLLVANPELGPGTGRVSMPSTGTRFARRADTEPLRYRLPYAEDEVRRIHRVLPNSLTLIGARATEAAFKRNAAAAGVVHIATHSIYDRQNYLDSRILFASGDRINQEGEDGVLYLHEIMNLRLSAALVILTGCETGLGRLRRGGGLEGVSRAFLAAGVPSVMGTLWPVVDSDATSDLMARLYKHLANGLDKRAALQKAKLELIAEKKGADPFYWAAFVLIGDTQAVKVETNFGMGMWIPLSILLTIGVLGYAARRYGALRSRR